MGAKRSAVLRRLKGAIEKVKFLMSTNLSQWLYIGTAASATARRRLSFKDSPGLLDAVSEAGSYGEYYYDAASASASSSRSGTPRAPVLLSRTVSSLWAEIAAGSPAAAAAAAAKRSSSDASGEDVDLLADAFIMNFRRHLLIERQVSLELRYSKQDSSVEEETASG